MLKDIKRGHALLLVEDVAYFQTLERIHNVDLSAPKWADSV